MRSSGHEDELTGRLQADRPEATPEELGRAKRTALSRTGAGSGRGTGSRRAAVLALTVGILAATTGGVIASGGTGQSSGNAAVAQYGNGCDVNNGGNGNGNGNSGNEGSNNGNNNGNCNENSFNTTNNYGGPTTVNNYTTVNAAAPSTGVLGSKSNKKATSARRIRIHVKVPGRLHVRRVLVRLNGRHLKTIVGKKASANIELVNLPCSKGSTTIEVSVTLSNGKTVSTRHTYHLCAS